MATKQEMKRAVRVINPKTLWCVCWYGETADFGLCQRKGKPMERAKAERRMDLGQKSNPELCYWLEPQ